MFVAFATLEVISPAHASESCNSIVASEDIGATQATADDIADSDGAEGDTQQPQRHGCCSAHTSSAPPLAQESQPLQVAQALKLAHTNDAARDRAPAGLERPPKAIAIV